VIELWRAALSLTSIIDGERNRTIGAIRREPPIEGIIQNIGELVCADVPFVGTVFVDVVGNAACRPRDGLCVCIATTRVASAAHVWVVGATDAFIANGCLAEGE
jgi:hypothetical protein